MEIHWYLVAQDGPYPWNPKGVRVTDYKYMRQLAGAIDHCGFAGALIATQAGKTDPWTLATGLATCTENMKFIVAQYAGVISPLWLAQMAATVDEISKGRLIINIITGNSDTSPALGIFEQHDNRYALAEEYWPIFCRLMKGEEVTFEGKYVNIKKAKLLLDTVTKPYPELMFGGSSPAALDFAAKYVDTWLNMALPPPLQAKKVQDVRAAAAKYGRKLRTGLRMHVIVRETEKEAWEAAQWLYDRMDPEAMKRRLKFMVQEQREAWGAKELHAAMGIKDFDPENLPKDARAFEFYPGLWSGVGLIRVGPGNTIVGDPHTVARIIHEYEDAGVECMILGGYPHIEEAYRFHDLVMPLLRKEQPQKVAKLAWV